MKIELNLRFRGLPPEVSQVLPNNLKYLSQDLEANKSKKTSHTSITVDIREAENILRWGREHQNGESNIMLARVYNHYDVSDLMGLEVVEIMRAPPIQRINITNYETALDIKWQCEYCDRVRANQVGDLEVSLDPKLSVQLTENSEWIISRFCIPLFQEFGCKFRPLKDRDDYVQLLTDQTFSLCVTVPPMITFGVVCPGCGLPSAIRNDLVEGQPPTSGHSNNMALYRDDSVSIANSVPFTGAVLRSSTLLGNPTVTDFPRHMVGTLIDYDEDIYNYHYPSPLFVAKAELVRKLLEAGATGLAFRLVNVLSEC